MEFPCMKASWIWNRLQITFHMFSSEELCRNDFCCFCLDKLCVDFKTNRKMFSLQFQELSTSHFCLLLDWQKSLKTVVNAREMLDLFLLL